MPGLSQSGKRGGSKAIVLASLYSIAWGGYAAYQAPPAGQDTGPGSFRILVDVPLVVLHATVTDHQHNLVANLSERDFAVYENGVQQRIKLFVTEDVPVTAGLVVDHSTTMRPKMQEVTAAARTFAQFSNPEDEMFVVNFHEVASLGLPPTIPFTHDSAALQEAIMGAPTGGETALYDAVAMGLESLRAGSRDKKALILISDGGDNASQCSLAELLKRAGQSSAVIYTVGVFDDQDPDRNPGVLKQLARATGGEAFFPGRRGDVVTVCESIARDIRHQYTFGYVPSNPVRDGSYRDIRVTAQGKGGERLSVRTRTGYVAGGEAQPGRKRAK